MRSTVVILSVSVAAVLGVASPVLAQEASDGGGRPWHYWIAPFLLAGAVIAIAALFIGYYVRVMGGRGRR